MSKKKQTVVMRIPLELSEEIKLLSRESGLDSWSSGKLIAETWKSTKKSKGSNNVWDYFKL